jgi:hypothetical protein
MITAVHALLYSREATAARTFFRDVLRWPSVDAGEGWLIFALPPAEIAVHPSHVDHGPELYLMCDDIEQTVNELRERGVVANRPIIDQGWGLHTTIRVPGNVDFGLYQPKHPIAAKGVNQKPEKRAAKAKRKPAKRAARSTRRKR